MTTTTPEAAGRLADLLADHAGQVWVGYRFTAEDAAAFAGDQETAGADFATIEVLGGAGDAVYFVLGGTKPTRPADMDKPYPPALAGVFIRAQLNRAGMVVRVGERWAAALARI